MVLVGNVGAICVVRLEVLTPASLLRLRATSALLRANLFLRCGIGIGTKKQRSDYHDNLPTFVSMNVVGTRIKTSSERWRGFLGCSSSPCPASSSTTSSCLCAVVTSSMTTTTSATTETGSKRRANSCSIRINRLGEQPAALFLQHQHQQVRFLRERVRKSNAWDDVYTLENPKYGKTWPPDMSEIGEPNTLPRMRNLMHQLQVEEMQKLEQERSYKMPKLGLGDLVTVKYELSRSQQTFATFTGYCVGLRKRRAASAMVLKNTYDGIAVQQLLPIYNPRLLSVRVDKEASKLVTEEQLKVDRRKKSRNYRNNWQYYKLGRWRSSNRKYWWRRPARSGILNVENKLRTEYAHLRKRYAVQRAAAGLPPYIHPGPYHITRRQTREVRAEMERRMLVHAWDERRLRFAKLARRKRQQRWGICHVKRKESNVRRGSHAKERLPGYHVLNHAES
ncbi:unnamed protein product [Amoebophrya sp. A120]|nr:unnamed protein product [Amoebophrya sp. A120]|eukprot:GSA120T00024921001.1